MGKIQRLDWGTIDWVYEPEHAESDRMRVGISTMFPGAVQPRHIHYGDEQVFYILSGHGKQRIGEVESEVKPGDVFHISAGVAHEACCDGNVPLVKLLVSIPALTGAPKVRMQTSERVKQQEHIQKAEFLRDTVRELSRSMLEPLRIALTIFDAEQNLVYKSREYPAYCRKNCRIEENVGNCELIRQKDYWVSPYYEGPTASVCEHGMWVYALPIVAEGELLGCIKAGHVRTREKKNGTGEPLPYNVPESTVMGLVQVIQKLSEAICDHYQVCRMQAELQRNMRALSDQRAEDRLLQSSLKTTQDQAFNLQINQHFLFNTLNTIAGMAVKEQAYDTYEAVGNLAQLIRYTLRTNRYFVTLFEETEYLKMYTNLQKMRFGDRLQVEYRIPSSLNEEKVPFNFLQPVVENCFKHGFANRKGSICLYVAAEKQDRMIRFVIRDNGTGMSPEALEGLKKKLAYGNAASGSTMVVQKLESLYGADFQYEVRSSARGTEVTICIPV